MSDVAAHDSLAEQFSAGLDAGELRVQHCAACGKLNMYPRHHCPFCQSTDLGWVAAAGTGVLHSFAVVRAVTPRGFEAEVPYAVGVVKLDEGVQLLGRLHPSPDGDWGGYTCDARVTFAPAGTPRRGVAWFTLQGA